MKPSIQFPTINPLEKNEINLSLWILAVSIITTGIYNIEFQFKEIPYLGERERSLQIQLNTLYQQASSKLQALRTNNIVDSIISDLNTAIITSQNKIILPKTITASVRSKVYPFKLMDVE